MTQKIVSALTLDQVVKMINSYVADKCETMHFFKDLNDNDFS